MDWRAQTLTDGSANGMHSATAYYVYTTLQWRILPVAKLDMSWEA